MVEGGSQRSKGILQLPHEHSGMCTLAQTLRDTRIFLKINFLKKKNRA